MAENFLSQEEVDALLKGVNGDQEDSQAPEDNSGVRPYNLATQERIVRGRMPTLEIINERFARLLRIGLFNFLHRTAEVSIGPVRVSKGVSEGLLLTPILPVYPAIARAARVQGAVVVEAVISKAGRIESLHAVSGPAMLQQAALDAISVARYRPYLLNGAATEVKTAITVVFTLGS